MAATEKISRVIRIQKFPLLLPMFFIVFSVFPRTRTCAQSIDFPKVQYLNWTALNLHLKWKDWGFSAEFQDRVFLKPIRQETILLPRLTLHKKVAKDLYAGVGFAYILHASPSNPNLNPEAFLKEIRPHLEIQYKKHEEKWNLKGRIRFEEKISEEPDPSPESAPWKWKGSGRVQVLFERYLSPLFYLKASEEFFISQRKGKLHFSENRIRSGMGYDAHGKRKIDLEYMHLLKDFGDNGIVTRHTIVFTFTEIISL